METKNVTPLKGFKNRHTHPIPKKLCVLFIITNRTNEVFLCKWIPYIHNKKQFTYPEPAKGYLGEARVIYDGSVNKIGFNVWEQNNDEFIYYKIVNFPKIIK